MYTATRARSSPAIHAVHELHRHVDEPLVLAEIEHFDDILVVHLGGELGLVQKHREEVGVARQVRKDALDDRERRCLAELQVTAHEDLGHAPVGEPPFQVVVAETEALGPAF
jgi:hypothetical protein